MKKKVSFPFFAETGNLLRKKKGKRKEGGKEEMSTFSRFFSFSFLIFVGKKRKREEEEGEYKKSCRKGKNEGKKGDFYPDFCLCVFMCRKTHTPLCIWREVLAGSFSRFLRRLQTPGFAVKTVQKLSKSQQLMPCPPELVIISDRDRFKLTLLPRSN